VSGSVPDGAEASVERWLARDDRGRDGRRLRFGWIIETERYIACGGGRRRRRRSSPRDTGSAGTAQIRMPSLPSGRVIWKRWPWPRPHACWGEARRGLDPASADRPGRSHAFVQKSASRRSSSARGIPLGSEMTSATPDNCDVATTFQPARLQTLRLARWRGTWRRANHAMRAPALTVVEISPEDGVPGGSPPKRESLPWSMR
jgi:hypothetical protein